MLKNNVHFVKRILKEGEKETHGLDLHEGEVVEMGIF